MNEYVHCRLANRPWVGDETCCKARRAHDKRTPGLFKVEWSGDGFVGLCNKTYFCFGPTDKYSTKGLSKHHNDIDKDAFLEVFTNRQSGSGKNRGFRVRQSTVVRHRCGCGSGCSGVRQRIHLVKNRAAESTSPPPTHRSSFNDAEE